jgi:carbohydrate binding protein with CBM4/9 domain
VATATPTATASGTVAKVAATPQMTAVPRIGLNLGIWNYYESPYRQNILINPGFEPVYEGRILIVANPTANSFQDNMNGLNAPSNYYVGASFSVRSGVSAGATGTISAYNPNAGGNPTFTCKNGCPVLNTGDIVSMYFTDPPVAGQVQPYQNGWWINGTDNNFIQTNSDHEPNSAGSYALQVTLNGSNHSLNQYLDQDSGKAFNYLPVNGAWQLSFWAKAVSAASPSVNVMFAREGLSTGRITFVNQTVTPTGSWQQYTFNFNATDGIPTNSELAFQLNVSGTSGTVLIDDLWLGSTSGSPGGWRTEAVVALQNLHPGVLRDSNSELGESFLERTADDTYHGPSSYFGPYQPGYYPNFTYTMTDFFALCNTLGAQPWIVMPDTVTDAELASYGTYLEQIQSQYHFPAIYIELGNENWNGLFRGAGIEPPASYGAVASRDFELLNAATGGDTTIKPIVSGQFASPGQVEQVAQATPNAPLIGSAPYFNYCEDTGLTGDQWASDMWTASYVVPSNYMVPIVNDLNALGNHQVAVAYEEGLSTWGGSATTNDRLNTVVGYMSGGAYMQEFINMLSSGFYIQNPFNFVQRDFNAANNATADNGAACANPPGGTTTPLWGMQHDIATTTPLVRPSGLALTLANQAAGGDFYPIDTSAYPNVSGAAFKNGSTWTAMFSNGNSTSRTVEVQFPAGTLPTTAHVLNYSSSIEDNNETAAHVTIGTATLNNLGGNTVSFTIPPWGALALLP